MQMNRVELGEVERGLQYLQGCLDIARTRSTELSRDYEYVERKVTDARSRLMDRGVFLAVSDAISASRASALAGDYAAADTAIADAATALSRALPSDAHGAADRRRH